LITIIHILGGSGSGTSTLGKEIESKLNYVHFDVDDYFWVPKNPPFVKKREIEERKKLLMNDILNAEKCVITGSLCGWGDVFIPIFDLIIRIEIPTEMRIERIKKREYERFGNRILQGGDMYYIHQKFLEWAKSYDTADINTRSKVLHDCWLKNIYCKKYVVDGTKPLTEKIDFIEDIIK